MNLAWSKAEGPQWLQSGQTAESANHAGSEQNNCIFGRFLTMNRMPTTPVEADCGLLERERTRKRKVSVPPHAPKRQKTANFRSP